MTFGFLTRLHTSDTNLLQTPSQNLRLTVSNTHYHPPDHAVALVVAESHLEIVTERSRRRWKSGVVVARGSSEVKAALPDRLLVWFRWSFFFKPELLWLPSHGDTPLMGECQGGR